MTHPRIVKMLLVTAVFAAACQSPRPLVTVVDWGVYGLAPTTGDSNAPKTGAGVVHVIDPQAEVPLLKKTNVVDATVGTRFGLRFVTNGTKPGLVVPLHVRVTHPPINGRTVDQWDIFGQNGIARFSGWRFDNESELVAGPWTLEILEGQAVVAAKQFEIRLAAR